jgi:hypothetical protein
VARKLDKLHMKKIALALTRLITWQHEIGNFTYRVRRAHFVYVNNLVRHILRFYVNNLMHEIFQILVLISMLMTIVVIIIIISIIVIIFKC